MNTEKNIKTLIIKKPLKLDCGKTIKTFQLPMRLMALLIQKKITQY